MTNDPCPVWNGSHVLVAGGFGFIGGNLVPRLVALGATVRATVHRREPARPEPGVEVVRCDLTRREDCERVVAGIDVVFMCAANSSGAAVIRATPLVHVTPNVVMNALLLEAAYHAKVRKLVWMSSSVAYPPTGDRPAREDEMLAGDPHEAYFGVGWMKRYTEMLCRFYSEKLSPPMATVVVRPSNLYGPGDDFEPATSHVTPALIRKVVERQQPLEVWGTGDEVRDLLYIDDFIDGLLLAAEKLDRYDPVNLALGKGHSVREVVRTILEIDGYADAKVVFNAAKPTTIPIRLFDTSKAERLLGFKATTGLREGLERTIKWYRMRRNDQFPNNR